MRSINTSNTYNRVSLISVVRNKHEKIPPKKGRQRNVVGFTQATPPLLMECCFIMHQTFKPESFD